MNKCELHHMTWKEIEAAFAKEPVVLVPLGSMEEHGPHSPTGDYLAAAEIARRIAEQSGAYSLPVIPFGYSEYFRGFPGTISFSPQTFMSVIKDICTCLIEHGITRILFINGHFGNAGLITQVARDIRRDSKVMIGSLDLWQSIPTAFKKELYGQDFNPSGHGGEPVTSVMMYLYPADMRMDLVDKQENTKVWQGFDITGIGKVAIGDSEGNMYFNMEEISRIGVMGNPYASTKERGQAIVDRLVAYGVEFVERLKKSNTKIS